MGRRSRHRFSRHGSGGSKQDEVGQTIFAEVERLLKNRWYLLSPFDMVEDPVRDLFRYALTSEQWGAWLLLRRTLPGFSKMLHMTNTLRIRYEGMFEVAVQLNSAEIPATHVPWANLPPELQLSIHNWVIRSTSLEQEYKIITARVRQLLLYCTTPGQIERTWPELLGFMPSETVDARFDKKARSPHPTGVIDWSEGPDLNPNYGLLKPEFKPEVLDHFNDSLAAALVLPVQGVHHYPSITML